MVANSGECENANSPIDVTVFGIQTCFNAVSLLNALNLTVVSFGGRITSSILWLLANASEPITVTVLGTLNSGMFVFRADVILREIEKYIPKMYKALMEIYKHIGEEDEEEVIKQQYELIDGISIDFGVMQRTRKAFVIKCDFSWDDIGSFTSLSRFLSSYRSNSVSENVYLEESENCSIFGEKNLIIGLGIKDLVIVDAGDVILVMDRNKDQDIKHLLSNLCKEDKYKKYL